MTREIRELSEEFRAAKLHETVLTFLARALSAPTLVEIEHAAHDGRGLGIALHAFGTVLRRSAWVVLVTRRDQSSGFEASDVTALASRSSHCRHACRSRSPSPPPRPTCFPLT